MWGTHLKFHAFVEGVAGSFFKHFLLFILALQNDPHQHMGARIREAHTESVLWFRFKNGRNGDQVTSKIGQKNTCGLLTLWIQHGGQQHHHSFTLTSTHTGQGGLVWTVISIRNIAQRKERRTPAWIPGLAMTALVPQGRQLLNRRLTGPTPPFNTHTAHSQHLIWHITQKLRCNVEHEPVFNSNLKSYQRCFSAWPSRAKTLPFMDVFPVLKAQHPPDRMNFSVTWSQTLVLQSAPNAKC